MASFSGTWGRKGTGGLKSKIALLQRMKKVRVFLLHIWIAVVEQKEFVYPELVEQNTKHQELQWRKMGNFIMNGATQENRELKHPNPGNQQVSKRSTGSRYAEALVGQVQLADHGAWPCMLRGISTRPSWTVDLLLKVFQYSSSSYVLVFWFCQWRRGRLQFQVQLEVKVLSCAPAPACGFGLLSLKSSSVSH